MLQLRKSGHIARNCNQSNNPVGLKCKVEEDQANIKSNQSLNSISQISRNTSNITASGCVEGKKRILTVDTGASHSIIRSDLAIKK